MYSIAFSADEIWVNLYVASQPVTWRDVIGNNVTESITHSKQIHALTILFPVSSPHLISGRGKDQDWNKGCNAK